MGYAKVKKIEITDNGIFLTSAESNIHPLYYTREELKPLSELLRTKGRKAVEMELLFHFFTGDFKGRNKYSNAIARAEIDGTIYDHYKQFLLCDDPSFRNNFLQILHSYLSRRIVTTPQKTAKTKPIMEQVLF